VDSLLQITTKMKLPGNSRARGIVLVAVTCLLLSVAALRKADWFRATRAGAEPVVSENYICLKRIDLPPEHTGYSFVCSGSFFQSFVFWFSLRDSKS
jgi:hypothetical protein